MPARQHFLDGWLERRREQREQASPGATASGDAADHAGDPVEDDADATNSPRDDSILEQAGLTRLAAGDREALLAACHEELSLRVGTLLAERMSEEEVEEFERLMAGTGEDAAREWLDGIVPDRGQIVEEQRRRIQAELAARAPEVLLAVQPGAPGRADQ